MQPEEVAQWLQTAADFEMNADFDISAIVATKETGLDFPEMLALMKAESKGKRTIQALGDKILLSKMLDNFGIPQMPVLFACHSTVDKTEVETLVKQLEASTEEDAFDIVVKPTHLSSSVGTVILSREAWIAGGWNAAKMVAHMEHFLAQKADASESEALKALVPGFVIQKCYRSSVEFQAPLEMRVVTLFGKAHIGIWWWGCEGPLALRTSWLVRRPKAPEHAYLPKGLEGEAALIEERKGKWRVAPVKDYGALAFRASKELEDKIESYVELGHLVEGVDEGNGWVRCQNPAFNAQRGERDEWEVLHRHTGYNPGFEAALKVFYDAMPAMAAAAEAIAKASGAPFLRSDFFAGSSKWGVRLNEVAYGSGCSMVRKHPASGALFDDGPNVAQILQEGYRVAKVRPAEHMLSKLGVHGSSYELETQDTAGGPGLHIEELTKDASKIPMEANSALAMVSSVPTPEVSECNCRTLIFAPPRKDPAAAQEPPVPTRSAMDVPAASAPRVFPVSAAVPQDISLPFPAGGKPGQLVSVMGPVGPLMVPLPAGVQPGQPFTVPIRPPGGDQTVVVPNGAQAGERMSFTGANGEQREIVIPRAMLPGQSFHVANSLVVAIPEGALPGDVLTFLTPRYDQHGATVPEGLKPGQYLWVQY